MIRNVAVVIALSGIGVLAASPLGPWSYAADTTRIVRLGFVNPHSPSAPAPGTGAFWERLRQLGYVEGQNILIDTQWADDHTDRLPTLLDQVLSRKPDVLVTWGGIAAISAKRATDSIPIVAVGLPVAAGLPDNLARPGGNLTGLSLGYWNIAGKWLELLKEILPKLNTVAVIANPDNPVTPSLWGQLQTAAKATQLNLKLLEVRDRRNLRQAFTEARRTAQAALVLPDSVLNGDPERLTALTAKYRIPTMHSSVRTVNAGGLIAYGPNFAVQWRRAADYVDKIVNGAKPGELPIEEPTQFELTVNLKTAKSLGIIIPEAVLLRATDVVR